MYIYVFIAIFAASALVSTICTKERTGSILGYLIQLGLSVYIAFLPMLRYDWEQNQQLLLIPPLAFARALMLGRIALITPNCTLVTL